jgi:hypothetical protein
MFQKVFADPIDVKDIFPADYLLVRFMPPRFKVSGHEEAS